MLSWTKMVLIKILMSVKNFLHDMLYEDGMVSKGNIGFWVCLTVIVGKFIKHGGDIPDNWLTFILALLAYSGLKKSVGAVKNYTDNKAAPKKAAPMTAKDDEEPVN